MDLTGIKLNAKKKKIEAEKIPLSEVIMVTELWINLFGLFLIDREHVCKLCFRPL